jgi:hypothetical protein
MPPRVRFREVLSGAYYLLSDPLDERPCRLSLQAQVDDLPAFMLNRTVRLEGTVDLEGWADGKRVEGTLAWKLFDERRLAYRVSFETNARRRCELRGQKEWTPVSPLGSMTVLHAGLYDAGGEEIGRVSLRFDVQHELRSLVASFGFSLS